MRNYKSGNPKIIANVCKDLSKGFSQTKIKSKQHLARETIKKIEVNNQQRIAVLKQELSEKYLDLSNEVLNYITRKKMADTSAHSLVSMGREAVYTSQLVKGEGLPEINITIPTNINELKSFILLQQNEKIAKDSNEEVNNEKK